MRFRKDGSWIRRAAVAGLFYPGSAAELRSTVHTLLSEAKAGGATPKALIAPHAGYVYSGPVAASVYATVEGGRGVIRRVVLLGPAHRVPFRGLAVTTASAFETPLGEVAVDREAVTLALSLPQVTELDEAHADEHSLEVHLPFLQVVLGEFSLVPLVVGDARPEEVAEVLRLLWGGPETLMVVSSDLSHYLPYDKAMEIDGTTAAAIEALKAEEIDYHQACGRIPLSGLLLVARERGLTVNTLDLRNSGDTAGPRHQVVGYGAFAFAE